MLEIYGFSKKYAGAENYSVEGLELKVADGEVCGLVGSNGAGKSTLIKSIVGILPFTEGTIKAGGFDVRKESVKAKSVIGYVPDDHSVYEKLTGREYVNYMGSIYGVKKERKKERIDYYAKILDIGFALDNQISSYSHGMKQKICIIGSLIHDPGLWILDEPMMGLDPQTTAAVIGCIRAYADKGNTVLFSSHNLDIVQKVCDRIAVIRKGKLVADAKLKELTNRSGFDLEKYFMEISRAE